MVRELIVCPEKHIDGRGERWLRRITHPPDGRRNEPEATEMLDLRRCAPCDLRSERIAREPHRGVPFVVARPTRDREQIERFAVPVIEGAGTFAHPTEVEAQAADTAGEQDALDVIEHRIVHASAVLRMGVTQNCDRLRPRAGWSSGVSGFERAGGAIDQEMLHRGSDTRCRRQIVLERTASSSTEERGVNDRTHLKPLLQPRGESVPFAAVRGSSVLFPAIRTAVNCPTNSCTVGGTS